MVPREKKMMAKSKAEYRGVFIYETETGCSVFLSGNRYNCKDLNEAVALIDAAHAVVSRVVDLAESVGKQYQEKYMA